MVYRDSSSFKHLRGFYMKKTLALKDYNKLSDELKNGINEKVISKIWFFLNSGDGVSVSKKKVSNYFDIGISVVDMIYKSSDKLQMYVSNIKSNGERSYYLNAGDFKTIDRRKKRDIIIKISKTVFDSINNGEKLKQAMKTSAMKDNVAYSIVVKVVFYHTNLTDIYKTFLKLGKYAPLDSFHELVQIFEEPILLQGAINE